jgi:branched-chain amino acid transport system ATP-binding protein
MLQARALARKFGGVRAVDGVSFSVAPGELVALIGPNGAGKTTCFNIIGGQLRPDSGQVLLAGRDVTGATPARLFRLGVGRTFQVTETFASMTLRENVQLALLSHRRRIWRVWRPVAPQCAREAGALLARVALAHQAKRAAGVLAYGDVKRLELAMALANQPRVLLMDEPTAGMARAERVALMRLVRDLARETAIAVLFTEHDMDTVFGVADRILVLDRGKLIAAGDADAIRADARVRAVYLGVDAPSDLC